MTTDELRARLDDPALAIVDTRPLHLFNGWRAEGAARGGHIPGAVAFPAEWERILDDADIGDVLVTKGITTEREVVLYGSERASLAARLTALGYANVSTYDDLGGVGRGRSPPARPASEVRAPRPRRLAPRRARRRAARGGAGRPLPPLPRQLRRPRGVRGEPPPRRAVPRHELAREPGRLEPPHAGRARGGDAAPRHHPRHDGRPLRPRHRGASEREVARSPRGSDRRRPRGAHPDVLRRRGRPHPRRRVRPLGAGGQRARDDTAGALPRRVVRGLDPRAPGGHRRHRRGEGDPRRPGRRRARAASGPGASTSARSAATTTSSPPAGSPATSGATAAPTRTTCSTTATWTTRCAPTPRSPPTGRTAGITPDKWVAFYCGTGWRASETWFYALLMGWQNVAVYDGGWFEWSKDPEQNPIQVGLETAEAGRVAPDGYG